MTNALLELLNEGRLEKIDSIPQFESQVVQEWLKRIKFAKISLDQTAELRSVRSKEDEKKFFDLLSNMNYYEGYGMQYLFGIVVFKDDNSWLERYEYDGSEWWTLKRVPNESDWID